MGAAIGYHSDFTAREPNHDYGLEPKLTGDPISRVGHLGLVSDENPPLEEQPSHLVSEDVRIGVQAPVDPARFDEGGVIGSCANRVV